MAATGLVLCEALTSGCLPRIRLTEPPVMMCVPPPPVEEPICEAPPSACDSEFDPQLTLCGARSPRDFVLGLRRFAEQQCHGDETTYDYEDKYWLFDPRQPEGHRWTSARYRQDLRFGGKPESLSCAGCAGGSGQSVGGSSADLSAVPAPGEGWVFIRIPAGEFCRTSTEIERDLWADMPPMLLMTIERDFLIAETETTRAQWESVAHNLRSHQRIFDAGPEPTAVVHSVDVGEGFDLCETLDQPPGFGRVWLPSSDQWIYTARAGSGGRYPTGDESRLAEYDVFDLRSADSALPAASRAPLPIGLYDLLGNLEEWTGSEWYNRGVYLSHPNPDMDFVTYTAHYMTILGGSYTSKSSWAPAADSPNEEGWGYEDRTIGFRCATVADSWW